MRNSLLSCWRASPDRRVRLRVMSGCRGEVLAGFAMTMVGW
jgi:hypothetical protein